MINTSTKKVISTIAVGSSPQDVAVAGTKVYVANSGSSIVSVINTATNNSVTTVNVGSPPSSLAVSQDGSMVVVAANNDNIAIIDTKTDAVLGAQLLLDTTTPDGGHVVAFGSDGRILVTDAADRTVRVVGLARGNTAPITIANPTVDNQDTVSGVVTGALNIKDPDQDPLKYTVSGVPTATGSVTVDSTGTYTFTPSHAARDQAAQPVAGLQRHHGHRARLADAVDPAWRSWSFGDHDPDSPRRVARLPRHQRLTIVRAQCRRIYGLGCRHQHQHGDSNF